MELPVFFGKKLLYQQPCVWSPLKNNNLELHQLNVSQIALGPKAKGKHILVCKVSGEDGESESMVLATLSHETNAPQMSVSLTFTEHVEFSLIQGSGPLYMTGATTLIDVDTDHLAVLGRDEEDENNSEENDDEDEDSDGDEKEDCDDADSIRNSIDQLTNELLAAIPNVDENLKMSKKGMRLLREAALDEHHRISDEYTRGYIGSKDEAKDVIRNWTFCGGNWDFVLQFQPASSEADIPRFTKLVNKAIEAGDAPKFSKKEKKARRDVLIKKMEEVDLEEDDDDDEEEEEGEEDDDMDGFIVDDGDDDEEYESEEEEDDDSDVISGDGSDDDSDDDSDDNDDDDVEEEDDGDDEDEIEDENMEILASSYRDSSTEREDLLANWNKFGGNWDLILEFQPLKEQERLQKIIEQLISSKKAKKFNKKERAKIRKEAEDWLKTEGIVLSKEEQDTGVEEVETMFENVGKESENEDESEDDASDDSDDKDDDNEEEEGDDDDSEEADDDDDDDSDDDDSEGVDDDDDDDEEADEHPGLKDLEKAHLRRQSHATPQKNKQQQQQPRSGKRKSAPAQTPTPHSGKKRRAGSK
eukprot:m.1422276 g.1422276  ORF g.1422276 m.1422276 type:complete len:586 (+) comp25050_c0_seq5:271-2028(+)